MLKEKILLLEEKISHLKNKDSGDSGDSTALQLFGFQPRADLALVGCQIVVFVASPHATPQMLEYHVFR